MEKLSLKHIEEARERIKPFILKTPLLRVPALDEYLNCEVYLKPENLQITGSFKLRGATNKLESLTQEEKDSGVIAASSGNHGQAVAYAARNLGIKATIVMPEDVNPVKLENCKKYGAETILAGKIPSIREAKMVELIEERKMIGVHSYADIFVKAGQGTMSLEILEDEPDMDIIVVPIGGGGMISGIAVGAKELKPSIKIIGIEPKTANRYTESLKANKAVQVTNINTIADGTRTDIANPEVFETVKEYVDKLILVEDNEIRDAMKLIISKAKIVAEPSSSMGVAAALNNKIETDKNTKVCFIISGGNNDLNFLSEIIG